MKEYPWRFEVPVGTKVFVITVEYPTFEESEIGIKNKYNVEEDVIVEIQDNSYYSVVNKQGEFTSEVERVKNWKSCNIGYWVKDTDFGHAIYFGDGIYLTREEAQEAINEL